MSLSRKHANQHSPVTPTTCPETAAPHASNADAIQALETAAPAVDDLGFLDGLDATFGSAIEESRPEFTTDDEALNRSGSTQVPKRWEDGKLRVPPQAQRPLHANIEAPDGSYEPMDLDDHSLVESDPNSTFRSWFRNDKDCAKASYASLDAMGYEAPEGDKNSLLKRGEIGSVRDGNLQSADPDAAKLLLDAIDTALLEGTPVMAGVDYPGEQTAVNSDGVTDHWLLITGREYDKKTGEVRYQAMDNADSSAPARAFTVGEDYSLTSEPPEGARRAADSTYTLTNARIPERSE